MATRPPFCQRFRRAKEIAYSVSGNNPPHLFSSSYERPTCEKFFRRASSFLRRFSFYRSRFSNARRHCQVIDHRRRQTISLLLYSALQKEFRLRNWSRRPQCDVGRAYQLSEPIHFAIRSLRRRRCVGIGSRIRLPCGCWSKKNPPFNPTSNLFIEPQQVSDPLVVVFHQFQVPSQPVQLAGQQKKQPNIKNRAEIRGVRLGLFWLG